MKNKNKLNRFEEYTVYGLNGVKSLLESDRCSINKIILSDNFDLDKFSYKNLLNKKYANKLLILNKNEFQNKYENLRTQGIVITFSYKLSFDFPIDIEKINDGCYVILDSIKDPQNLGQIIRTSECAGTNGIILPERRSVKITSSVLQVSQGAFCNLDIIISKNIKYSINELKDMGYWIVGLENSIESKFWYEFDLKGKIGFVFGSEGEGIRPVIQKYCDELITIPMNGKINSLNISATVSAMLFERNRQLLKNN